MRLPCLARSCLKTGAICALQFPENLALFRRNKDGSVEAIVARSSPGLRRLLQTSDVPYERPLCEEEDAVELDDDDTALVTASRPVPVTDDRSLLRLNGEWAASGFLQVVMDAVTASRTAFSKRQSCCVASCNCRFMPSMAVFVTCAVAISACSYGSLRLGWLLTLPVTPALCRLDGCRRSTVAIACAIPALLLEAARCDDQRLRAVAVLVRASLWPNLRAPCCSAHPS